MNLGLTNPNHDAIHTAFVQFSFPLELSRSSLPDHLTVTRRWGKMSKHSVPGGDFAGLMERFAQLQEKASCGTGQSFRIHSLYRRPVSTGLDSPGAPERRHRKPRRRRGLDLQRRAGAGGKDRQDRWETLVRALLAYKPRRTSGLCNGQGAHSGEEDAATSAASAKR